MSKEQKIYFNSIDEILDMYKNNSKWFFADGDQGHYEFRGGVPCFVYSSGKVEYNCRLDMGIDKFYRVDKKIPKHASKKDIGKFCCFWCDQNETRMVISQLKYIEDLDGVYGNAIYQDTEGARWPHCSPCIDEAIEYWKEHE